MADTRAPHISARHCPKRHDSTVSAGAAPAARQWNQEPGGSEVVRPGEAGRVCLNTTGIGVPRRPALRMSSVRPGDRIVLSGHIGNHTVHLLSIREGLGFDPRVLSDCVPLNGMIGEVFKAAGEARFIRCGT
jgi:hydrogenase maturation factor